MMSAITISKLQARKFLLYYHGLYGEFAFRGKHGIMDFIRRVGCIQFDPLDVVGKNAELVLQSRIQDFESTMLGSLLYSERQLIDYWDKNMSIFPVEDWPYFRSYRNSLMGWCNSNMDIVERVRSDIELRGPLCSGDLQFDEKVQWSWGPTRLSRAALEGMYHAGSLVIHHKSNTRKYYELAERLIPEQLYGAPDPFLSKEQHDDWNVLRRIGSVGLLWNRPSDAWLGIRGLKSLQRNEAFARLLAKKLINEVNVEGLPHPLYMRHSDEAVFNHALSLEPTEHRTSILAPLDNLLWDRTLIKQLFDFEYRWEVYKPIAIRQYGYYVLPVLFGDKLIARFEPMKHKNNTPLVIKNWWWEDNVNVTGPMKDSILECLNRFAHILDTVIQEDTLLFMNTDIQ
jgi:uncharacterized protein YcaQ